MKRKPARLTVGAPKRLAPTFYFLLLAFSPLALAHEGPYEQLAQVTLQIRKAPSNPALYLQRGELYRLLRQWENARGDYDRAARLDVTLAEVDFYRGRMWLAAAQPRRAQAALDRFLKLKPAHAEAWLLRAQALTRARQHAAAVADYTRAINLLPRAKPDHYLARAQAQMAAGQLTAALRGLDEGIAQLGPLVTLQTQAIAIELSQKNWDEALTRLDKIAAQAERKESWLVRRAEILWQAGRKEEARAAWVAAVQAIEELPPRLRQLKATIVLEKRARSALGELSPTLSDADRIDKRDGRDN